MRWSFAKYVGCGNDFILFDNSQKKFPLSQREIQRICHRQWGIGADGILLLEPSSTANYCMRIFNADGSEAEMCGNGLRCFVQWLIDKDFKELPTYLIEVGQRIFKAFKEEGAGICIEMGPPSHMQWNISLPLYQDILNVHYLNTGVPHVIIFVDNINTINLVELGSSIRHHPFWLPQGTNVTFTQIMDNQTLKIRTYERGIEAETLACGTGATAAALAAAFQYHIKGPFDIQTRSGEKLKVNFSLQQECFSWVTLLGTADYIFQGEIDLMDKDITPTFIDF